MIAVWLAGGALGSLASTLLLRETAAPPPLLRDIEIGAATAATVEALTASVGCLPAFAAGLFVGIVAVQLRFAFKHS